MEWHSTMLSYFQPSLSSSLRQIATFLYRRVAFYRVQLLSHSSSTWQNPTLLYSKVASYHVELLKVACHGRMLLCYIAEWQSTVLSYFQSPLMQQLHMVKCYFAIQQSGILPCGATIRNQVLPKVTRTVLLVYKVLFFN